MGIVWSAAIRIVFSVYFLRHCPLVNGTQLMLAFSIGEKKKDLGLHVALK